MTHETPALDRAEILRQTQGLRDLALFLLRDAAAADDVVQSAWLAEVQGRRPADVAREGWLRGVVRNLSARFARDGARRRRREARAARPEEVRVAADTAAARAESHRRLTEAVLALDEPYRAVVLLRFFEGLPPSEIAARTGEAPGTVRTRLSRALAMLRARLDRDAGGDGRAWALALAPLVGGPAASPRAAPVLGGAAMKTTHVAAAAALLLLVAAGAATYMATGTRDASDEAASVPSAGAATSDVRRARRGARAEISTTASGRPAPSDAPQERDTATAIEARPDRPGGGLREAKGVVVDRATGAPLAGARVLLCHIASDTGIPSWYGDSTDDGGRFDCSFDGDDDLSAGRMEIRARKAGYEDVRRAAESGEMRIELVARERPAEPGRVVGLVLDRQGHPCPGRLLVEGWDDFGAYQAQWTRADAAGTFVLEGVPAGHWRLRADGEDDGGFVEVLVPERGEARMQLVTDPPERDMTQTATIERAVADLEAARRTVDAIAPPAASGAKRRAEESEKLAAGVEAMRTRVVPGRDVAVAGLPPGSDGAVARLTPKERRNWFWRARVEGAGARFDDVPPGSYVLRVETATGLADAGEFEVVAGEGPLEVRLGAAR